MSIYLSKSNQHLGPFNEEKVREMLNDGQLSPGDLAIRQGERQWQRLAEMFPNAEVSAVQIPSAQRASAQSAPKKSRKGMLLGCSGFFLISLLITGVLGVLAYRNMNPAHSPDDLPETVKDLRLNHRYPPKGDIWGTETIFMGIYSDAAKTKTVIYLLTVYSSESAAKEALRRELADSCKMGESPMYFKFVKNGADVSEGATCSVPLFVQKDNKLVTLGGPGADVEVFIEFAENLKFNNGAEMKKK